MLAKLMKMLFFYTWTARRIVGDRLAITCNRISSSSSDDHHQRERTFPDPHSKTKPSIIDLVGYQVDTSSNTGHQRRQHIQIWISVCVYCPLNSLQEIASIHSCSRIAALNHETCFPHRLRLEWE